MKNIKNHIYFLAPIFSFYSPAPLSPSPLSSPLWGEGKGEGFPSLFPRPAQRGEGKGEGLGEGKGEGLGEGNEGNLQERVNVKR
ncbi:MAG: hypothetical protein NC824_05730 [Candidatus Omnitrophica bacterium]|nr:hypothetical protein [Candidatus Omnitrophota bacterium]